MAKISSGRMSDRDRRERAGVRKQRLHLGCERLVRRIQRAARSDEHEQEPLRRHPRPAAPHDLLEPPPRAVPLHRTPDAALAGDEADAAPPPPPRPHPPHTDKRARGHPPPPPPRRVGAAGPAPPAPPAPAAPAAGGRPPRPPPPPGRGGGGGGGGGGEP